MAFFEELKKTITDVSGTVAKKSGEVVEVQKLKMKKYSIESDIRKDYEMMGRIYFAEMEETGKIDDTVEEIFQRIVEAKDAVAEIEEKLSQFGKGKVCTVCGEKAAKNMTYCPYCGSKFEDAKAAEEGFAQAEFEEDVKTDDVDEADVNSEDVDTDVTEDASEETQEVTSEENTEENDSEDVAAEAENTDDKAEDEAAETSETE